MKEVKNINTSEALLKSLKGSFYKLNVVASLIRGLPIKDAESQLIFCKKRMSNDVLKVLKSAIANAVNNEKMNREALYIKRVDIGKSLVLKRSMPRGRGRSSRIEKRFSNIRIVVSEIVK